MNGRTPCYFSVVHEVWRRGLERGYLEIPVGFCEQVRVPGMYVLWIGETDAQLVCQLTDLCPRRGLCVYLMIIPYMRHNSHGVQGHLGWVRFSLRLKV